MSFGGSGGASGSPIASAGPTHSHVNAGLLWQSLVHADFLMVQRGETVCDTRAYFAKFGFMLICQKAKLEL